MTPELELANKRIAELELKLKAVLATTEEELHVLPSGDLHRGIKGNEILANIEVDKLPDSVGNKLNIAMAKILTAAKGGHALTCLWCGISHDGHGAEKDMREHLKKDHASVIEGYDKITPQLLMADLEAANERLKAAGMSK